MDSGVDFDDPEYGFKEEDKDDRKVLLSAKPSAIPSPNDLSKENNERILHHLADECDGVYGTVASAIAELGIPRLKTTRLVPSYKGQLTLGNPDEYDSAMTIYIERYPRTMIAKPPSATNFALKLDNDSATQSSSAIINGEGDHEPTGDDLTRVKNERRYYIKDANAPEGRRDIEGADLAKGYEYGRTAVHISESDETVTKFESTSGLEIVGFVPRENVGEVTRELSLS